MDQSVLIGLTCITGIFSFVAGIAIGSLWALFKVTKARDEGRLDEWLNEQNT